MRQQRQPQPPTVSNTTTSSSSGSKGKQPVAGWLEKIKNYAEKLLDNEKTQLKYIIDFLNAIKPVYVGTIDEGLYMHKHLKVIKKVHLISVANQNNIGIKVILLYFFPEILSKLIGKICSLCKGHEGQLKDLLSADNDLTEWIFNIYKNSDVNAKSDLLESDNLYLKLIEQCLKMHLAYEKSQAFADDLSQYHQAVEKNKQQRLANTASQGDLKKTVTILKRIFASPIKGVNSGGINVNIGFYILTNPVLFKRFLNVVNEHLNDISHESKKLKASDAFVNMIIACLIFNLQDIAQQSVKWPKASYSTLISSVENYLININYAFEGFAKPLGNKLKVNTQRIINFVLEKVVEFINRKNNYFYEQIKNPNQTTQLLKYFRDLFKKYITASITLPENNSAAKSTQQKKTRPSPDLTLIQDIINQLNVTISSDDFKFDIQILIQMFRRTIQMDKYYANGKLKGIFKMSDYLHYQGFKFIFRTYLNNLIQRHYQLFMKFLYDQNPHKTIKNNSLLEYMLLENKLFIEFYKALNKNLSPEDLVTRNHLIIQVNIAVDKIVKQIQILFDIKYIRIFSKKLSNIITHRLAALVQSVGYLKHKMNPRVNETLKLDFLSIIIKDLVGQAGKYNYSVYIITHLYNQMLPHKAKIQYFDLIFNEYVKEAIQNNQSLSTSSSSIPMPTLESLVHDLLNPKKVTNFNFVETGLLFLFKYIHRLRCTSTGNRQGPIDMMSKFLASKKNIALKRVLNEYFEFLNRKYSNELMQWLYTIKKISGKKYEISQLDFILLEPALCQIFYKNFMLTLNAKEKNIQFIENVNHSMAKQCLSRSQFTCDQSVTGPARKALYNRIASDLVALTKSLLYLQGVLPRATNNQLEMDIIEKHLLHAYQLVCSCDATSEGAKSGPSPFNMDAFKEYLGVIKEVVLRELFSDVNILDKVAKQTRLIAIKRCFINILKKMDAIANEAAAKGVPRSGANEAAAKGVPRSGANEATAKGVPRSGLSTSTSTSTSSSGVNTKANAGPLTTSKAVILPPERHIRGDVIVHNQSPGSDNSASNNVGSLQPSRPACPPPEHLRRQRGKSVTRKGSRMDTQNKLSNAIAGLVNLAGRKDPSGGKRPHEAATEKATQNPKPIPKLRCLG